MKGSNDFDAISPYYDHLSWLVFGKTLKKAPLTFLNKISRADKILIVGGGTGGILKPLINAFPQAEIHYYEPSKKMLEQAQTRFKLASNRLHFYGQPLQALQDSNKRFDLVLTPFVLDLFSPKRLEQAISIIYNLLEAHGNWLHCDFYVDKNSPWWQRQLNSLMHGFFKVATGMESNTLQDFDKAFNKHALLTNAVQKFSQGMIQSVWYEKV